MSIDVVSLRPKMPIAFGMDFSEGYAPHQKQHKHEYGDPWPEQPDQTDGGAVAFHHCPIHFARSFSISRLKRMTSYQRHTWFIIVHAFKIVTACSMIRLSFFREEVWGIFRTKVDIASKILFGPSFSVTFPVVLPISYIGSFRGVPPVYDRQARIMKMGFRDSRGQGFKQEKNSERSSLAVHSNPWALEPLNPDFFVLRFILVLLTLTQSLTPVFSTYNGE
jgi:hypothetical protein